MKTPKKDEGDVLWWAMFVAGVAVVTAPRTTVIVLIWFALLGVIRVGPHMLGRSFRDPIAYCLVALLAWAAVTMIWTGDIWQQTGRFLSFAALVVIGILAVAGAAFSGRHTGRRQCLGFFVGLLIGATVIAIAAVYAIVTGDSLWGDYYFDPLTVLNSSAVILSLLFWLILYVVRQYLMIGPWLIGVSIFALLLTLSSTSAVVGVVVGGVVITLWRIVGRKLATLIAVVVIGAIVFKPSLIAHSGAIRYAEPAVANAPSDIPYSFRHRLAMWSFATEKIEEKPVMGWGMGEARRIPQEDRRLLPNMEVMPLHPHSLAMQTRLELGVPGVLLISTLFFLAFREIGRKFKNGNLAAMVLASSTTWLLVANLSYGMWQSWWVASVFLIGVISVWLRAIEQYEPTRKR